MPGWWLAAAIGCNENQISTFVPEIVVVPADRVDFGRVAVPGGGDATVTIGNGGRAALDVALALGTDAYTVEPAEASVGPGDDMAFIVHFAPDTYLVYEDTLTITSNDAESPTITLPITGEGVHLPTPDIDVTPLSLDFGALVPGDDDVKWVTIANKGDGPLTLGAIGQAGSGRFRQESDASRAVIGPGDELPLLVSYAPTTADGDSGDLTIPSDDPDEPAVKVQLLGNGGGDFDYPFAAIDCPGTSEPPTWVVLDGRGSGDPSGALPLSYAWVLAERPDGSQAELDPDDTPTVDLFTDVAGTYAIDLSVENALGVVSAPERCEIEAIPADALHVELTWDGDASDLDLHLRQEGGALFDSPGDVSFCNPNPSWGDAGPDDDPRLDLDDRSGLGPENINIFAPKNGRYRIAVHYFENYGDGDVTATVRVYAYGVLVSTLTHGLSRNEVWEVGQVNWPDGTVGAIGTVASAGTTRKCY